MGESGTPNNGVLSLGKEYMFLGQYRHSFDEKGRITIPSRYREILKGEGYVAQGFDQNLMVFTVPVFESLARRLNQANITDSSSRLLKRLFFAHTSYVEVDKVGRILIPQYLREWAGLTEEVMVIGSGDYFELWSPELWKTQEAQLQNADENSQRFAAFQLTTQ